MFNKIKRRLTDDLDHCNEILSNFSDEEKESQAGTYNYWVGRKGYIEEMLRFLWLD